MAATDNNAGSGRRSRTWSVSLALAGLCLVTALLLQGMRFSQPAPKLLPPLKSVVPESLPGCQVRDEPIGATEGLTEAALKILDFDDVVYRTYICGDKSFSVYIAAWRAGKKDWPDIATHTPDICWPANGWRCTKADAPFVLTAGSTRIERGQWREFELASGSKLEVVFWHYLNGSVLEYSPYKRFSGMAQAIRHIGASRGSQYFVRVSSATPIEQLTTLPAFQEVIGRVGRL